MKHGETRSSQVKICETQAEQKENAAVELCKEVEELAAVHTEVVCGGVATRDLRPQAPLQLLQPAVKMLDGVTAEL